jgi:hypothetical protein
MDCPRLSTGGSTPKYLRSVFRQFSKVSGRSARDVPSHERGKSILGDHLSSDSSDGSSYLSAGDDHESYLLTDVAEIRFRHMFSF